MTDCLCANSPKDWIAVEASIAAAVRAPDDEVLRLLTESASKGCTATAGVKRFIAGGGGGASEVTERVPEWAEFVARMHHSGGAQSEAWQRCGETVSENKRRAGQFMVWDGEIKASGEEMWRATVFCCTICATVVLEDMLLLSGDFHDGSAGSSV